MASSVGPVQVKLELGHRATARRRPTPEGFTHDWCVSVRGPDGAAINHFVEKVVFHLHESFAKPKRVCREPPYKVEESGYAGFILPIEVYFKNKEEPRKVKFDYDLFLHLEGQPPVNHLRCEKLTFSNPPSDFRRRLLKAGGMMVSPDGMAVLSAPPEMPSSSHLEHRKPPASLHVKDFSKPIASLKPPKPFKGHKEKPSESKDYKAPAPSDGPSRESAKKAATARVHKPRDEPQPPPPATPLPKAPSKEPKALSKRDRSDAGEVAEPAPVAAESREPKPAPKRSRTTLDDKLDAKRAKKPPSDVSSRQWASVSSSSSFSSSSSSSSASSASAVTVPAATASASAAAAAEKAVPKERPSKGGDVDGVRGKGKTMAAAPAAPAAVPAAVPVAVPTAVAPVPAEERARDKTWRKKHEDVGPASKPHGKSHSRLRDKTAPADREPPAERISKAKDKLNSTAAAAATTAAAISDRQQPDRGVPKDRDGRVEVTPNTKTHRKVDKEVVVTERKVAPPVVPPALSPPGDVLDPGDSDDELSLATDERPASVASGASSISHGAAPEPAQSERSFPEPLSVSPSEDEQEPPSAPKSSRSSELSDSEHSSDASPAPPILRHANKAYMEELVRLHRRLMMLRERSTLQQVVNLIEETGHFQVTSTTFDFDLFSLDQAIVRKLQSYLGPTEAV